MYYGSTLAHHGVPGQKWGVRNGPPYPVQSGTSATINKKKMTAVTRSHYKGKRDGKQPQKDVRNQIGLERTTKRAIRVSSLTDEQLRRRIERLKLETEYKKLLRGDQQAQQKSSNGQSAVKKFASKFGDAAMDIVTESVKAQVLGQVKRSQSYRTAENDEDINDMKDERKRARSSTSGSSSSSSSSSSGASSARSTASSPSTGGGAFIGIGSYNRSGTRSSYTYAEPKVGYAPKSGRSTSYTSSIPRAMLSGQRTYDFIYDAITVT